MKSFVGQRSFSRCGPLLISGAAAVVLTILLLVIKRRQQPGDEEHSSDRSNPGEPGPEEREGNAPDDDSGFEGSDQRVQASEDDEQGDGVEEDEDYVVISKEEGISARVHDIVRTRDPEAAAAIGERLSLSDQEGGFAAMIRLIIESSADPARLEDALRPLGEKQLATEVKESYVQSLSEALVQAVGEALRGKKTLLPHTVAAWDDFLAIVWACMMLAGAYECLRRKRESGSVPANEPDGGERLFVRGWRRRGGLLQYNLPRPLRVVPAVTVKHGNARDSVVTSLAGVAGFR